jgi:hypothetical protein
MQLQIIVLVYVDAVNNRIRTPFIYNIYFVYFIFHKSIKTSLFWCLIPKRHHFGLSIGYVLHWLC